MDENDTPERSRRVDSSANEASLTEPTNLKTATDNAPLSPREGAHERAARRIASMPGWESAPPTESFLSKIAGIALPISIALLAGFIAYPYLTAPSHQPQAQPPAAEPASRQATPPSSDKVAFPSGTTDSDPQPNGVQVTVTAPRLPPTAEWIIEAIDWTTNIPRARGYARAGETVALSLEPGAYRVVASSGTGWLGPAAGFDKPGPEIASTIPMVLRPGEDKPLVILGAPKETGGIPVLPVRTHKD